MKKITLFIFIFSLISYFFNSRLEICNYSGHNFNVNLHIGTYNHNNSIVKKEKNQSQHSSNKTKYIIFESIEEEFEEKNKKNSPNLNSFQAIQNVLGFIYHSGNYISNIIYSLLSNLTTSLLLVILQIFRL